MEGRANFIEYLIAIPDEIKIGNVEYVYQKKLVCIRVCFITQIASNTQFILQPCITSILFDPILEQRTRSDERRVFEKKKILAFKC